MKHFLRILPRFIREMIVGAFVFVFFVTTIAMSLWGFHLIGFQSFSNALSELFLVIFMLINFPLIWLLHYIEVVHWSGQGRSFEFAVLVPALVVYNGFLFALFCELFRLVIKRKNVPETTP